MSQDKEKSIQQSAKRFRGRSAQRAMRSSQDSESQLPTAKAGGGAAETDRLTPRKFLEPLARIFERDAHLMAGNEGSGTLLASSAEVVEFGFGDDERAVELYKRASEHDDADARAFSGLRRHARLEHDIELLRAAYSRQFDKAPSIEEKVLAGCGLTMLRMRRGEDSHSILSFLEEHQDLTEACSPETRALYSFLLEDAYLRNGRSEDAVAERVRRFTEFQRRREQNSIEAADAALSVASLHEALGLSEDTTLSWYETAFDAAPTEESLRPLLERVYRDEAWDVATSLLGDIVKRCDDDDLRTSCRYQLGMLRAFRSGDRAGALQSLGEAMKSGNAAPLAATAFLAIARSSHGSVLPDEFVDALSARLDFAASPVERADLLTQMARRFDEELEMPEAAVEMAREALDCCANWVPAMRCLSDIYSRDGHWEQYVELQLMLLEQETNAEEISRVHERVGRAYQDELLNLEEAEKHLKKAIESGGGPDCARRLARLYAAQFRWEELHRHLMSSAEDANTIREKTYFTEEAAEVAEHRLRNADLAIDSYLALLELDTSNATAMSSLDRLYRQTERWEDLLRLNEHELSLVGDDENSVPARLSLLCRCASLAVQKCSDLNRAEGYLSEALELDPTYREALREMGALLKRTRRWDALVEMTERQLRHVEDVESCARCYRQLGELYATNLNDPRKAISWFRKLAELDSAHAEEARIWLERLYEAAGMPEARLDILRERQKDAGEGQAYARLAYRIAELLDWELNRPAEAFTEYLDALDDTLCVEESLRALGRLWNADGLTRREHLTALRIVQDASGRMSESQRRLALTFVAEQGHGILDDDATRAVWSTVAREWPNDLKAGEFLAALALRDGDVELAEEVRARRPAGPIEAARAQWAHLDRCLEAPIWEHGFALPKSLQTMLAREEGADDGTRTGADRELFKQIHDGECTLESLRGRNKTETDARLSIMAAREMGESVALRREWQDLIRTFSDNRRALRGWLDLCEEKSSSKSERSNWLREAETLGCYGHPMREALYTAFQSNDDIEGFVEAVDNHLRGSDVEGEAAAKLALRKGHALDHLGRREAALDAMRFANIHAPAMTEAAVEKARLESQLDRVDDARQTLEDVLDAGASGRERLEVLGRLSDLHLMDGGNHDRAVRALEDAWELSGRHRDWGIRLANAHATYGDASRAETLLDDVLGDSPEESELRHWHLLARLQEGPLDKPEDAEETLWMLFREFPSKTRNLEALYNHYRKRSEASRFAARLRDLLIDGELELEDDKLAALWRYVGELFFSVLSALPEAEYAFEAAARLDGGSAKTSLKLAKCISGQDRREREALTLLRSALLASDASPNTWQSAAGVIEGIYERLEDGSRQRVARQLLRVSEGRASDGDANISRMPSNQMTDNRIWELLGGDLFDNRDRYVLQAATPLTEKVLLTRAQRKVKGDRRLDDELAAFFLESMDRTCWAIDTETPKVKHRDDARGVIAADNMYLIDEDRVEGAQNPAAQFWAGYAAAVAFSEMGVYLSVEDDEIMDLLRSVAVKSLDYDFREGAMYVGDVGGFLNGPQRRPIVSALKEIPEFFETTNGAWRQSIVSFCDRLGLIACGDLSVAVDEILSVSSIEGQRPVAVEHPRVRDLVSFALSDAFYVARYELGLARRPVLMDTPNSNKLERHAS